MFEVFPVYVNERAIIFIFLVDFNLVTNVECFSLNDFLQSQDSLFSLLLRIQRELQAA